MTDLPTKAPVKWSWPILKVNLYPGSLSSLQGLFTLNLKEAF